MDFLRLAGSIVRQSANADGVYRARSSSPLSVLEIRKIYRDIVNMEGVRCSCAQLSSSLSKALLFPKLLSSKTLLSFNILEIVERF